MDKIEEQIAQNFEANKKEFMAGVDPKDPRVVHLKKVAQFAYFNAPHLNTIKVLDVGCGKGRFIRALKHKDYDIYGIDPTPSFFDHCVKTISRQNFRLGSATKLPYADETFDFVYCIEVLEHIPHYKLALAEMQRVLKKDGYLLVIEKSKYCPQALVKWFQEKTNTYFYPKEFPYKERWFTPTLLYTGMPSIQGVRIEKFKVGLLHTFIAAYGKKPDPTNIKEEDIPGGVE